MPRALPWKTDGAVKTEKTAVKKEKPAARQYGHGYAASGDDIVNSDLDAVSTSTNEKKEPKKKRFRASSSSPPPPGPPPVERIKPGFAADDIYMMVEDEFYSTAQLYTGHIHHAEYARLKKLHKSRGQEILAGLGRGTDGKTEQSKALRSKMESLELAKKQKQTVRKLRADVESESDAEGSEAEDEYMQDPHLAGLMRASQMAPVQDLSGLASPRASTRAAAGYSQSPYKEARTKDVFAEEKQQQRRNRLLPVDEDDGGAKGHGLFSRTRPSNRSSSMPTADEDSETDEEDLDAGVPSSPGRSATSAWAGKAIASTSGSQATVKTEAGIRGAHESRPFAKFARPATRPTNTNGASRFPRTHSSERNSRTEEVRTKPRPSIKHEELFSSESARPATQSTPPREGKYMSNLVRKRAERAAAEAKRKAIKKEDIDDIPTFLF